MNLASTLLTMICVEQGIDFGEIMEVVAKRVIRGALFLLHCLMGPLILFRALKSKKRCPPVRNKLLLMSATELAKKIRAQEVTSEEVVLAYIERCREVNPVINAVVETRFESAIEDAKEADQIVRSGQKNAEEIARETPLLGIPITVKESIGVQGMSNVAGTKYRKPETALQDADVVQRVREAGGIILLVSNTPEMCMCWETYNNVTGITVNPYDSRRSAGGSSGGEAALLGSAASLLSLSSDIGGSVRLPAMFCGVFGHKPTPGTISTVGHMPDCDDEGWPNFFSIGPMVRYAEDLPLLLQIMCRPNVPKFQMVQKVPLKKIRFFYMENDGGSGATSSVDQEITSGIHKVVGHLRSHQGVAVQKAELTGLKYAFEVAALILLRIDGVETIFSKGRNLREWKSVFVEVMKYLCFMSPHTFPNVTYGILKKLVDSSMKSYSERMKAKNKVLQKQFADLLGDDGVLIYPTFVSAAHYPYEIYHKICNVSYMMIFNSLGLPVTQCPVGLNRNGLPIGLQVVANPGCDHLTITLAQEIERVFGGWQPPESNGKMV